MPGVVSPSSDRNPVEALAEEFVDRVRRGERPTLDEYCRRYPELAGDIRDLFPLLLRIENLGADSGGDTTGDPGSGSAAGLSLERLGDFRILREVGRGGMGIVYEAEEESLGRRVALKVLPDAALGDAKQVLRFQREARAAARLHHTNIVPVFGVGQDAGHHFYVMQFIPGMGLDAVLEELRRGAVSASASCERSAAAEVAEAIVTGRFSGAGSGGEEGAAVAVATVIKPTETAGFRVAGDRPPTVLPDPSISPVSLTGSSDSLAHAGSNRMFFRSVARIGRQVAEALEYANRQGVLHRDVKPSNLLLDPKGNVWVTDFGLAKATDTRDVTEAGDLLGTVRYMAPERFEGKCDARSDVYALGLTLYELLALRPAYEAADRPSLIRRVMNQEPEPLGRLVRHLPRDLETIVARAIARDPAKRYQTAGALAEDLQRFLDDKPITARRVGAWEQAWRWARRNPVIAALASLAVALLLAISIVASAGYVQVAAALKEANRSLYHSLVGEARALRLARVNGYREQAQSRLRRALRIESPDRDLDVLRHEAVACLGDFVGFAPREFSRLPAQMTAIALHPHHDRMVLGLIDGTLLLCQRTTGTPVARLTAHQAAITSLAFGPGGEMLVSGDQKGTIKIWERTQGDNWRCRKSLVAARELPERWEFLAGLWESSSLVLTPDGALLAARSPEKIVMWNLAGPDLVPAPGLAADSPGAFLQCLALSPDGKSLAAGFHGPGRERGVIVWDVATRRILQTRSTPQFYLLAFSPDSSRLVCGGGGGHFFLDARTLQQQGEPILSDGVQSVAFSPDGQLLAVATIFGKVSLRSVALDDEIATMNHPDSTGGAVGRRLRLAFSPDGKTLLAVGGHTALSWSLASAAERLVLYGNPSFVEGMAFSRDGRFLAIAHGDPDGSLTVRDASTGQVQLAPIKLPGATWVAMSPDSTVLAACSNKGRLELRSMPSLEQLAAPLELDFPLDCVGFSADGKLIAGCGISGLWIWKLAREGTGRDGGPGLSLEPLVRVPGHASFLCFSPDGTRIAWVDDFRSVKLWDVKRGCAMPFRGPNLLAGWKALSFFPDGRHLVMITESRTAEVWDVESGTRAFTLGEAGEFAKSHVAPSPDGRFFAGDHTTKAVGIWDVQRRRRLFVLPDEHSPISHPLWSPDGARLAIGMKDGRVILWDLPRIRAQLAHLGLDW